MQYYIYLLQEKKHVPIKDTVYISIYETLICMECIDWIENLNGQLFVSCPSILKL